MNIKHTERQWGPRQWEDLVSAKSMLAESGEAEISMHLKHENFFLFFFLKKTFVIEGSCSK